jgi:hypothetical protein
MALYINGSSARVEITSTEEIQAALEEFNSMVQEAILIDGREYSLSLSFSAREVLPGDEVQYFGPF